MEVYNVPFDVGEGELYTPTKNNVSASTIRDYAVIGSMLLLVSSALWIVRSFVARKDSKISAIHRENARLAALARQEVATTNPVEPPPKLLDENDDLKKKKKDARVTELKRRKKRRSSLNDNMVCCQPVINDGNESVASTAVSTAASTTSSSSLSDDGTTKSLSSSSLFYTSVDDLSPIIYNDGCTKFIHIPRLPKSAIAHAMLQRLAREFLPIIRKRGYNVSVVSELCCCTDGVYETEQQTADGEWKKKFKKNIDGHNEDDCWGYNHSFHPSMFEPQVNHIYIRLRQVDNHYKFLPYKQLISTMTHEMAHCIHANHSPPFWKLKKELEQEYYSMYSGTDGGNFIGKDGNLFGDEFNIYGSSSPARMFST